jgi:hypothetical protein
MIETESWLRNRLNGYPASVAGYTVCAPAGAERTQEEIEDGLSRVLALGHPTTIYQLPQVTRNTISPETVARLAARFENFVLFKDSSGTDTVALAYGGDASPVSGRRVFLVRGAEGDYGKWLKENGGPYDGYLLSTANCFAAELARIVDASTSGTSDAPEIKELAASVSGCVVEAFAAVAGIDAPGNAFTHANKAMDHFMAYGPDAPLDSDVLPVLYGGVRLPQSVLRSVRETLHRWGRMPSVGYWEDSRDSV